MTTKCTVCMQESNTKPEGCRCLMCNKGFMAPMKGLGQYLQDLNIPLYVDMPDGTRVWNKADRAKKDSRDLGGQLWEECERCGDEPIYTKYHLCESCSP